MKSLTAKIIIPLTIISIATLTKWWYVLPVDAPDTMFTGFPFPFVCDGWHTSLSLQIFVREFFADFLTYFICWLIFIFCVNRFVVKLNPHKAVTTGLWSLSVLIIAFATLFAANADNRFYWKRTFDMKVMATGFQFGWQHIEKPDSNHNLTP
jgi:hypothetical protein